MYIILGVFWDIKGRHRRAELAWQSNTALCFRQCVSETTGGERSHNTTTRLINQITLCRTYCAAAEHPFEKKWSSSNNKHQCGFFQIIATKFLNRVSTAGRLNLNAVMKLLDEAVSCFWPTTDEQRQSFLTQGLCSWWLACDDTQPTEWKMPLIKWSAPPWTKTTARPDKKCLSEHFPLTLLFLRALFVSTESFLSSLSNWHRGLSA